MEVIWSEFAEGQLDEIFEYYSENASVRIAKKLVKGLIHEPEKLIRNPFIGQVEPLLQGRKESYHYLVYKNYKIIYSVNAENGFIKIADVFDARQNPKKMERTE
ncbi:type II toxin-antitoxin system RelE/ParE family toxin [Sinomicrobium kalidii]|uniref:type II toxin-antitoxin system RelE/ParE family toxin n=1 Tax=Sinomicrobium kalidii TaxID=2900738 RepID=UPI001E40C148|nr:type II toxin-antitoxin system RelE/ParE family toxin [Sinomicrobium kalidii]UGU17514.1 type II toxin-antitoxin system RelE/ParE family toxin [Sinomicrobium kalidii]